MSVGFGFSVGDFITGLRLLWNIVDALNGCGEATADYRGLIEDTLSLETAFVQVKRLEFGESLVSEHDALKKAVSHVEGIVKTFHDKTTKFRKPLSEGGSALRVQDAWKKVQWALFKKEDVAKFRQQLRDCTGTINLLLATTQMKITVLEKHEQRQQRSSIAAMLHENYLRYFDQYQNLKRGITDLVDMTRSILNLNKQMFQLMAKKDTSAETLPAQVELQPSVHLLDALGCIAHFSLDLITAPEHLFGLLELRFRWGGAEKIRNGEFILEEYHTSRRIDLEQPWETCFVPGETIRMTFIFFGRNHFRKHQTQPSKRPQLVPSSNRVEEIEDEQLSNKALTSNSKPNPSEGIPLARKLKRKFNMAFSDGLPEYYPLGALIPKPKRPDWQLHASNEPLFTSLYSTLANYHKYTDENVAGHITVKHD